jgi:hypothetical protein
MIRTGGPDAKERSLAMNRRRFFLSSLSSLVFQRRQVARQVELQVTVMEAFLDAAGPSALLVHHTTAPARSEFASWLRSNGGASIICTLPDGRRIPARIFRLNGCFGRGLIVTREIINVRAKDTLSID